MRQVFVKFVPLPRTIPSGMVTSLIKYAASHRIVEVDVSIGINVKTGLVGDGMTVEVCTGVWIGVEVSSTALTVCAAEVLYSAFNVAACGVLLTVDGRLHAKPAVNRLSKIYNNRDLVFMSFSALDELLPINPDDLSFQKVPNQKPVRKHRLVCGLLALVIILSSCVFKSLFDR
jgi:hypothetical protein